MGFMGHEVGLSTPSLGITNAGLFPAASYDGPSFNSLSRDHRYVLSMNITPILLLSTPSLGITSSSSATSGEERVSFNSLSRDHCKFRVLKAASRREELSTPSLGITRRGLGKDG